MEAALTLLASVALPEAIGAVAGWVTSSSVRTWYPSLRKPSFNPPSWVFAPVWTALYLLMGVASWMVWRQGPERPEVRFALAIYLLQLLLNGFWSLLFFGLKRPDLALAEILALTACVAWTILAFRAVSGMAAVILLPYLLWVCFAALLNLRIWWLNRG